jgi:hypothetical protein|tara:strand:- start:11912 stop:12205 length:294 start_codon:yes stop_codon:yes gene_type:complete
VILAEKNLLKKWPSRSFEPANVSEEQLDSINGYVSDTMNSYWELSCLSVAPSVLLLMCKEGYEQVDNGVYVMSDLWAAKAMKQAFKDRDVQSFLDQK